MFDKLNISNWRSLSSLIVSFVTPRLYTALQIIAPYVQNRDPWSDPMDLIWFNSCRDSIAL